MCLQLESLQIHHLLEFPIHHMSEFQKNHLLKEHYPILLSPPTNTNSPNSNNSHSSEDSKDPKGSLHMTAAPTPPSTIGPKHHLGNFRKAEIGINRTVAEY